MVLLGFGNGILGIIIVSFYLQLYSTILVVSSAPCILRSHKLLHLSTQVPLCDKNYGNILNLTAIYPIYRERLRITIEKSPFVESGVVFSGSNPMFAIVMPVFNAQFMIPDSLGSLLNETTSSWSLDIVLDFCSDNSSVVVYDILSTFISMYNSRTRIDSCKLLCMNDSFLCRNASFPQYIRIIKAETPLYECKAENIAFSTSGASKFYISVQSDQQIIERGWNHMLSIPTLLWSDIMSVSANCAHNILKSKHNRNSYKNTGKCNKTERYLLAKISANYRTNIIKMFPVRDTSNRGPLLFEANKMRALKYFDEFNFLLSNDEHDLHLRGFAQYGWQTGFYSIGWKEIKRNKDLDRKLIKKENVIVNDLIVQNFIKNRDGGYYNWPFRGIKPENRNFSYRNVNVTRNRDHIRYMTMKDIERAHISCNNELYHEMFQFCKC